MPIVVVALRGRGVPRGRALVLALVAHVATHPLLWFAVASPLQSRLGAGGLALAELGAVLVEAAVFAVGARPPVGGADALAVAIVANGASLVAGLVVLGL